METTLTISYTTRAGHVKHITVGRGRIERALKRITSADGTVNFVTS
jgi:hypothetical protein